MKPKPVIVFDFGGVLLDWNPHYLYGRYFNGDLSAVDRFLEEIDFQTWNVKQDEGRSFKEAVAEMTSRFPQHAALIEAYDEEWESMISGALPSMAGLLDELKQNEYILYGLSNWSQEKFEIVRRKYPFFSYFEDIVISGQVRIAKPDPKIFHILLDRIPYDASECLFIDDSLQNIEIARNLGFNVIHFSSPDQLRNVLTELSIIS